MQAFQTDEVVVDVAHLATILTVNIARGFGICGRHGLHPHGRIKEGEVFAHVIVALLTKRTCICLASHVHRKTTEVHYMPAFQSSEGLCTFEHGLVTDRAVSLQSLWDAMMIFFDRDARIAAHAVIVIDAQALAGPTHIAERAVIDGFSGGVIVEVANVARVSREGLPPRMAFWVDAFIAGGLQGAADHA